MNDKMVMFLFELAQKGAKLNSTRRSQVDIGFFNPYHQFPKYTRPAKSGLSWNDKRFLREHGSNYRLHPELSRHGAGGLFLQMARPLVASPLFWVGAATVGLVVYTGMNEPTQRLEDLPDHPWNRPGSMLN